LGLGRQLNQELQARQYGCQVRHDGRRRARWSEDISAHEAGPRGGAVQIIGDDLRGCPPKYARLMEVDDKAAAFYTDRDSGRWKKPLPRRRQCASMS